MKTKVPFPRYVGTRIAYRSNLFGFKTISSWCHKRHRGDNASLSDWILQTTSPSLWLAETAAIPRVAILVRWFRCLWRCCQYERTIFAWISGDIRQEDWYTLWGFDNHYANMSGNTSSRGRRGTPLLGWPDENKSLAFGALAIHNAREPAA